ncbi:TonB family protein [Flavobacteriaceae bacterium]|nr:TonB family protein [Flavobacteriaceae bacterium]
MKRYLLLAIYLYLNQSIYSQTGSYKIIRDVDGISRIIKNNQTIYTIQGDVVYDYQSKKEVYRIDRSGGSISLIGPNMDIELESVMMGGQKLVNFNSSVTTSNDSNIFDSYTSSKNYDGSVTTSNDSNILDSYTSRKNYDGSVTTSNDSNILDSYTSSKNYDGSVTTSNNSVIPKRSTSRKSYYNPELATSIAKAQSGYGKVSSGYSTGVSENVLVAGAAAAAPKFVNYSEAFSQGYKKSMDAITPALLAAQANYNSPEAVERRLKYRDNAINQINNFPRKYDGSFLKNIKYLVLKSDKANNRKYHKKMLKRYFDKYRFSQIKIVYDYRKIKAFKKSEMFFINMYDNIYYNQALGIQFLDFYQNVLYSSVSKGSSYNQCYKSLFNEIIRAPRNSTRQKVYNLVNDAIKLNDEKSFVEAAKKFYQAYNYDKNTNKDYLYYAASSAVNGLDYKLALDYYLELRKIKYKGSDEESKFPEIVKNIALIYAELGDNEKTLSAVKEARVEDPKDLNLILTEANLYIQLNENNRFEALMKEAIEQDPNNATLYFNLGVVNAQKGMKDNAKGYYEKAIELDPNYESGYLNLVSLILESESVIREEMNSLGTSRADVARYDVLKVEREDLYKECVPILEKLISFAKNEEAIKILRNINATLDSSKKRQIQNYEDNINVNYTEIENAPVFPGCEKVSNSRVRECFQEQMAKHIQTNFSYPEIAQELGIQGLVNVYFIINTEGYVKEIKSRGPDINLEKAAEEIIKKLPSFTPAYVNGKAVNVPFTIKINFKLK